MSITKIKRSQFATYLDKTPSSTATWAILGVGVTDYAISYNPQVDTEKWIIEDNARTTHESNEKQSSVCFLFFSFIFLNGLTFCKPIFYYNRYGFVFLNICKLKSSQIDNYI